jgi:hypothetical protein
MWTAVKIESRKQRTPERTTPAGKDRETGSVHSEESGTMDMILTRLQKGNCDRIVLRKAYHRSIFEKISITIPFSWTPMKCTGNLNYNDKHIVFG